MTLPAGAPWVGGLATVCHELRRPLTVIRGAATLLLESHDQLPADDRAQILGLIDQSAQAMSDLVDDLAVLALLEAGQLQVALESVQVGELMETALEAVGKWHPEAQLGVVPPEELTVEADPEHSVRVLRALVSAAVRLSPEGTGPLVSARASGGQVQFLVALPAGLTIDEQPERGFEPFSSSGGGQALALYLSRGLARLMSGEVAVVTLPGGASAFSFNLNRRV